jgi:crotonobetainyl-CoA:carnitine CoA-transferase CaiB-like acyl-CoA transferase
MADGGTRGALDGVKVVDFSHYIAGPMAAMMLADSGADVIRVDPPGGPRWDHPANAVMQRGKRSIILDLRNGRDLDVARRLVAAADVVIEGFRPGTMARWGLSFDDCAAANPGLIWCSLPGFGHDDPRAGWRAWEGIICAAAGLYPPKPYAMGGPPRFTALPMASTFAAMVASHSILGALIARQRDGLGDLIEIPLFDAAFEALSTYIEDPRSADQVEPKLTSAPVRNPAGHQTRGYKGADGAWVTHCGLPPRGVIRFWDAFLPAGLRDRTDAAGTEEAARLLTELFAQRGAETWERFCQDELAAPFAVAQTSQQWLHDEHALASECVISLHDPVLGETRQAGFAVGLSDAALRARSPRRALGADGDAILADLAAGGRWRPSQPAPGGARPDRRPLPLSGIRVVDYTSLLAGPMAARVLAEYGADVIKVNKAAIGHGLGDPEADDPSAFAGHRTTNAGKRCMYLDLKSPRGQQVSDAIISTADVVHVNFTPAAAERLGLGEKRIRAAHPQVVYSTLNLHSRGGWRELHRGHEHLAEAVTGMSLRFGGDAPELHPIIVNDHATGHLAAFGIMLALLERGRSGTGQRVETSLSRTSTLHQLPFMIDFAGQAWLEPRGQEATGWGPLDRLYPASDGWLYLAAIRGGDLQRLNRVEGLAGADTWPPAALPAELARRLAGEPGRVWQERLLQAGVAAHVYRDIATVARDPLVMDRRLTVEREHPGLGRGLEIGVIPRFRSFPGRELAPACAPGHHTASILQEAGYGAELESLLAEAVVAGPFRA